MAGDGRSCDARDGLRVHPYLRETVAAFAARYRDDPRCAGMYLWGSAGAGTGDEWSDIDLALVVEDGDYDDVCAELREVCEQKTGRIALWFPEGRQAGFCNYAFLFEHDGGQFLYDFAVMTRTHLTGAPHRRPGKILFDDTTGLLADLQAKRAGGRSGPGGQGAEGAATEPVDPQVAEKLGYEIQHYWIYGYLNGKYWKRQDLFKLLYVQQTLLTVHLRILRALHAEFFPPGEREWWPNDARRLPDEAQASLLRYFPEPAPRAIRAALKDEVARFAADARSACARWEQPYPTELEEYVLRHLRAMDAMGD